MDRVEQHKVRGAGFMWIRSDDVKALQKIVELAIPEDDEGHSLVVAGGSIYLDGEIVARKERGKGFMVKINKALTDEETKGLFDAIVVDLEGDGDVTVYPDMKNRGDKPC